MPSAFGKLIEPTIRREYLDGDVPIDCSGTERWGALSNRKQLVGAIDPINIYCSLFVAILGLRHMPGLWCDLKSEDL